MRRTRLIWYTSLLLLPLIWIQGQWISRRTPRLAEAAGPRHGCAGIAMGGEPLTLVGVGESPVAGVGIARQEDTVTARCAYHLSQQLGRPVRWYALAITGARLDEVRQRLIPRLAKLQPDLLFVVSGVNDCTGLTTLPEWRRQVQRVADALQQHSRCGSGFSGVPPMQYFQVLPTPLRQVLGARARLLEQTLTDELSERPVRHIPTRLPNHRRFFAADGYHPSELASDHLGRELADALAPLMGAAQQRAA